MSEQKIRLAHLYIQQADTSRQLGNIKEAVDHFTKAIDIYKDLAEEEPACWSLVADTIEQVGATYKAAGELEKAAETFKEVALLREAMVKRAAADAG